jgi:hypothetical protein
MQMQMREFSHRTTILAAGRLCDPPKRRLKSRRIEEKLETAALRGTI